MEQRIEQITNYFSNQSDLRNPNQEWKLICQQLEKVDQSKQKSKSVNTPFLRKTKQEPKVDNDPPSCQIEEN